MIIYDDNPQRILLSNRTRIPSLEELTSQVNALTKLLINKQTHEERIVQLENQVAHLNAIPEFSKKDRSLDTSFVVSSERRALVFYTIELSVSRFLSGTDSATVDILIDGVSQSDIKSSLTATLALGVGITNTHQKVLVGFVPAGSTVNLTTSGTGSVSLIQSLEILL